LPASGVERLGALGGQLVDLPLALFQPRQSGFAGLNLPRRTDQLAAQALDFLAHLFGFFFRLGGALAFDLGLALDFGEFAGRRCGLRRQRCGGEHNQTGT
jgi:hypothetical protein